MSLNPADWTMLMREGGEVYPFVEDENANITGLGHQDKVEFAAAINRYDTECNGEPFPVDEQWDEELIVHRWACLGNDNEHLYPCPAEDPGAVAVTTLWGWR